MARINACFALCYAYFATIKTRENRTINAVDSVFKANTSP